MARLWCKLLHFLLFGTAAVRAAALELPIFDFGTQSGAAGWEPTHDISKLEQTPDGLIVHISGADPFLVGPARDYPPRTNLWLHLRLKSDQSGMFQVFYFHSAPTEPESVQFSVPANQWYEARVPMPPLGPGVHLRLDPPGKGGICILARLWFSEAFSMPGLLGPKLFTAGSNSLAIQSGALKLTHNRDA
jgi:hypothetical protein